MASARTGINVLNHADKSMSYEEIEVKFLVDDLHALRQRVLAMGATLHTPRTYEDNWCFDTPDQRLRQEGCLFRLRRDRRARLTYKEPAATADTAFKIRQEYEIEVSDFAQAREILEKLGFTPIFRYEKYRETYRYQDAEILFDDTPLGIFMEIEASRETIETIIIQLDLDTAPRLTAGYAEIFQAVCTAYALSVTDMTFDNFTGITVDLRTCQLA